MSTLPNNAKAVIALTSWKARINTVGYTLFNLLVQCPGFHIVLTLSIEEFPNQLNDLPDDLVKLYRTGLIEILWCDTNPRAFKKILFAMNKYQDIPIISADDDCIYKYNYAEELYNLWKYNPKLRCCYWCSYITDNIYNTSGYATLHPPFYYGAAHLLLNERIINLNEDDLFYAALCAVQKHKGCICLHKSFNEVACLHDETTPLHNNYRNAAPCLERFNTMLDELKRSLYEHNRK